MNILVTGGCGLAGSFAVRHAVEQGHRVVAFDIAIKTDLLTDVLDRVDLVRGDLTSAPDIMRAVEAHSVETNPIFRLRISASLSSARRPTSSSSSRYLTEVGTTRQTMIFMTVDLP